MSWAQIHLAAFRGASRVHNELHIDRRLRIDPFEALASLGVIVLRRPLHGVAGLYLPETADGSRAGVLVNVVHPVAKQRFTAAHELSHHRNDPETAIDSETDWATRGTAPPNDRERLAEAFAAWFLMPRELIADAVGRLGIDVRVLSPRSAYRLALELGTSYQATVNHLRDLGTIGAKRRAALLSVSLRHVKEELGARDASTDLRRDVWEVDLTQGELSIRPTAGDIVVVEATETPSTGYLWSATAETGLSVVASETLDTQGELVGSSMTRRFLVSVDTAGGNKVNSQERRPWQHVPLEQVELAVHASPRPESGIVDPSQLLVAEP